MLRKCLWTFLLSFAWSTCTIAIGDVAAGKAKSEVCVACHMADGNSVNPIWPKIAGQHEAYAYKQLLAFKQGEDGQRWNPTMFGIVLNLTEQDLSDLAAYFATEKMTLGKADPALVARGEKLYRGGDMRRGKSACIGCHGPRGMGNELAKIPRLAGQHAAYTVQALKDYSAGNRSTDPNEMMRTIAKHLTEEDMEALASYVEGLR